MEHTDKDLHYPASPKDRDEAAHDDDIPARGLGIKDVEEGGGAVVDQGEPEVESDQYSTIQLNGESTPVESGEPEHQDRDDEPPHTSHEPDPNPDLPPLHTTPPTIESISMPDSLSFSTPNGGHGDIYGSTGVIGSSLDFGDDGWRTGGIGIGIGGGFSEGGDEISGGDGTERSGTSSETGGDVEEEQPKPISSQKAPAIPFESVELSPEFSTSTNGSMVDHQHHLPHHRQMEGFGGGKGHKRSSLSIDALKAKFVDGDSSGGKRNSLNLGSGSGSGSPRSGSGLGLGGHRRNFSQGRTPSPKGVEFGRATNGNGNREMDRVGGAGGSSMERTRSDLSNAESATSGYLNGEGDESGQGWESAKDTSQAGSRGEGKRGGQDEDGTGDTSIEQRSPVSPSSSGRRSTGTAGGGGSGSGNQATSPALGAAVGGMTALQRVMSRTRPRDLPPKDRKEDNKHLKEFTKMMEQAKQAEKKKDAVVKQTRQSRESMLVSFSETWEKEVLPNWKAVYRPENVHLRNMWWEGSMPPRHRGRIWGMCIGNGLAVGKASYTKSLASARSLLSSSRYPPELLQLIESDIERTLPKLKLFQKDIGPLWEDLRDLLLAYSVFWRERPGYSEGSSYLAAMLLISMPVQDAFLSLVNLTNKSCLKSFYANAKDDMEAYYRVFDTLLADTMPAVYRNFQSNAIRPSLYLKPWLMTVYVHFLPFDTVTRIFDVFLLEGDSFLFRVALAILQVIKARLFNPDQNELEAVFSGDDRGARLVAARVNGLEDVEQVSVEETYEQYGCDEDAIFEALKQMEWKESTFLRLVERELPE